MNDDILFSCRKLQHPFFYASNLYTKEQGYGFWDETETHHSDLYPTIAHAKAAFECYLKEGDS